MDCDYTAEQELLRKTVGDFARQEIAPHASNWDEAQYFPRELIPRLAALGLMGVTLPDQYGGAGLGFVDYAIAIEELARVDAAVALSVAAHNSLCAGHIFKFGREAQKQKYLPPLALGEKLGGWALTEPSSGSDAASLQTRAERLGSQWVLNGSKSFTTHGTYGDIFVVMASTGRSRGAKGISAFIVEKGTAGLTSGKKENKLGCRASDTAGLIFEECRLPEENILGKTGEGLANALEVLETGRVSLAALAVGIAQGALDCALKYAREREQFGRPICEFRGVQFKLADMETRTQAARWLTYRAAWLKDQQRSIARESSIAKYFASEAAVWVSEQAVQIHGGYGYIKDYPAEKYWRDSKVCTIGEGTSEIQKLIIARELLRSAP
ncbi:MAG: acyl-CoA dehydrogenase family protein [Acidobacteria bacterium]|nr:acyl-CoA dehydrogenase family protein [Acidobacteriota bacterium]